VIDDTMFFPRLRRHAKWMFLLLALAFALGFVGFGVGAGGIGIGDVFRNAGGGSGVPAVSEAEKRVAENPKDAQALRDLATAYQAAANTEAAIAALEDYTDLRPKDANALRELAGLYLGKASDAEQRAQILQYRALYLAPGSLVDLAFQLGDRPSIPDPVTSAITARYDQELSAAYGEIQDASSKAIAAYAKIVAAQPTDPAVRLELAQAAQSAGDTATAITAYEAFLRLAPDDPTAPEVERLLKQLRRSASAG
jgi:tetratricopeptide (TPR) repeat protein